MQKIRDFLIVFIVFSFFVYEGFSQPMEENQGQTITYTKSQQKLRITAKDVKLIPEQSDLGGYHLYVKKLPNINSILLTETTKDPTGKNDSYTYRAKEYNKINGDEIRILDGKPLVSEGAKYSLVDSTVENTSFFGPAFHIYIPPKIVYGYEWTRHGEVEISKGTFINIRAFEKPYGDYTGNYLDNPFMFDFIVKKVKKNPPTPIVNPPKKAIEPEPIPAPAPNPTPIEEVIITDSYNPIAGEKFKEISEDIIYSKGPETLIQDIFKIFKEGNFGDDLDVVFAIDATGSMKDDIEKLKDELAIALSDYFGEGSDARVGLLFYRDYGDTYKYMNLPVRLFRFTQDIDSFNRNLKSIKINGKEGGDIPEAVYEAMYAASEYYDWRENANKQVILIGDAEPHPTPRGTGKYSRDFVLEHAESKGIKIHSILLPNN